jgi:hypothetical protein
VLQKTTSGPSSLSWPIVADAPDLSAIVQAQAKTITDQEALLHAYQTVLNTNQTPPTTTATGTGTGTSLVVTAVTAGPILLGATVTGNGVPASTTVTAQTAGTPGGAGTYTTSNPTTVAAATVTFTPGGGPSPWPSVSDAPTLNIIVQDQTSIIRNQTALLQQYQDLLNASSTPAPPTGP